MSELTEYFAMLDRVSRVVDTLPRRAAMEAVNFTKDRFKQQNWLDNTTQPWKKRKAVKGETKRSSRRSTLVKSGRLRKSPRVIHADHNSAIMGTDVEYAQVHNDGFRGRVNQRVRSHIRNGKKVKSFKRTLNMNIPQRQFIGDSAVQDARIQRMMTVEITKAIKS
jgi:phage gpG-like protein